MKHKNESRWDMTLHIFCIYTTLFQKELPFTVLMNECKKMIINELEERVAGRGFMKGCFKFRLLTCDSTCPLTYNCSRRLVLQKIRTHCVQDFVSLLHLEYLHEYICLIQCGTVSLC